MKKLFIFLSAFFLLSLSTTAQKSIQSMVFDSKNGLPLELCAVKLLQLPDSALVQGAQTNSSGSFMLTKVKPGNYVLVISMVGYVPSRLSVTVAAKDVILKNVQLREDALMLKEVEVKGTAAQMTVKGDTVEYNATAFKTVQNAVVEDLLKKMPGIEIGSDGKITANGQSIANIRVNGKKFFSGDIEAATKNLPADMIDKVQILDQKSDQAQLTGFEDNSTERIINLTTKSSRVKGVFGNVTGGAGLDIDGNARYDANTMIQIMDGPTQTALLGGANNTNTSRSGRGRGGMGNPSGGLTQTQNIGANINTDVNKTLKIGGDASANHSTNESITENNTINYLSGSTFTNHSFNNSTPENWAANLRLEAEWKPDSLKTILIQPTIGYNRSFQNSTSSYTYLTGIDTTTVGNSLNTGSTESINANLNITYSTKFKSKKGRTLTVFLRSGLSQSNGESTNMSNKTTHGLLTSVNQHTLNDQNSYNLGLNVTYVEPLWDLKNLMNITASASLTNTSSVKDQNSWDPLTGGYTRKDSVYSNNFDNQYYSESLELSYKRVEKLWNLTVGGSVQPTQTISNTVYGDGTKRDVAPLYVVNFAPTARFQYNFTKRQFLRADYNGRPTQPNIDQMQPVKNNSNQMSETVGNPSLNPSFSHNLRLMYSAFNDASFSSLSTSLNLQATKDALVQNSIYDQTGKSYNQTVNAVSMPYMVQGSIMFNTPVIAKTLHFQTNTSLTFNQKYGYSSKNVQTINTDHLALGDLNSTANYNGKQDLSLTLTQDVFEIGAKGSYMYSNTKNSLNPVTQVTKNWTATGSLVLHLPYNINIGSDINYSTIIGYTTVDQKQLIWNGYIDKSIFKSNKGVIALKVNDILHQQLNYRQTIGDNSISYSKFNTLPTYFILSFSYKIADFAGSGNRRMGGMGGRDFNPGDMPAGGMPAGGMPSGGMQGGGGGFGGGRPN